MSNIVYDADTDRFVKVSSVKPTKKKVPKNNDVVFNHETGKLKKDGRAAKKMEKQRMEKISKHQDFDDQVYNPETGNYVKRDGDIGKKIISKRNGLSSSSVRKQKNAKRLIKSLIQNLASA